MPHAPGTRRTRLDVLPIALLIGLCLSAPAAAGDPEGLRAGPILEFSEAPGALEGPNTGPHLSLYADGTLVVVYPAIMRRAGRYSARLDPAELRSLLDLVLAPGVLGFDATATRAAMRGAPRVFSKSGAPIRPARGGDETISALTIAGESAAGARKPGAQRAIIRWQGVARDAAAHPSLTGLQALERARRALRAQLRRPDLVPE